MKGEAPKLVNNRKMRKKEVFDAQKPEDIDLQTIQKLRHRLELKDAKQPYYKYRSELFIVNIKIETRKIIYSYKIYILYFRIIPKKKTQTKNMLFLVKIFLYLLEFIILLRYVQETLQEKNVVRCFG